MAKEIYDDEDCPGCLDGKLRITGLYRATIGGGSVHWEGKLACGSEGPAFVDRELVDGEHDAGCGFTGWRALGESRWFHG